MALQLSHPIHGRAFCSRKGGLELPGGRSALSEPISRSVQPAQQARYQNAGSSCKTSAFATGRRQVCSAAVEGTSRSLRELNQGDFYKFLEDAGDRLVVVDFYTDWCGPCKVMLPLLEDLAEEMKANVDIVKFNCNSSNKELGQKLNIRVAPTFHLYKKSNKVAEMTGAKIEELTGLIRQNI